MPYPSRIDADELGARALAVAEAKGWEAWTLRDVAKELGVTANALYRHVGDRAGLVIAMGEAAARALSRSLRGRSSRRPAAGDPDAAAVAMALRYVRFAQRRPHAYAAFIRGKPPVGHPGQQAWIELWAGLHALVRASVPEGADAAGFALWALLHGRVELAQGPAHGAAIDAGLEDAVRALLEGFRAGSPVPSPLPPHVRLDPDPTAQTHGKRGPSRK